MKFLLDETISSKEYLDAIYELLVSNNAGSDVVKLTHEQTLMLQLSDKDITSSMFISQDQLDKDDLEKI